MTGPRLDPALCRVRQQRLLPVMQQHGCDLAILTRREHVQWLCGVRVGSLFEAAAALALDGRAALAAPNQAPDSAAADDVVTFEAQSLATLRSDQRQRSLSALLPVLQSWPAARRVGVEFSQPPQHLAGQLQGQWWDLEPALLQLRRRKERDELELIRQAIGGTERMYQRAREILAPGISELAVFNQLQSACVEAFGEPLTATGNDYQCGSPGGPPRSGRTAEAGELYILDLGPAYRGYFADNCRTLAVHGVSARQAEAWQVLCSVFAHVERAVSPGKSARELYFEGRQILVDAALGDFFHHLGHGIGLYPHEAPYLNPNWDDAFQAGDVFTVEPGLYAPPLRAGLRIEQNYLVTDSGVELLSRFPLDL